MNIESIDPNNEVTSVAEDAIRAETGVAGEVNEGATAEGRSNEAAAEDKGSLYPLLLKSLLTGVLVALF
ncbi:MAG: hypothetical protein PUG36_03050, partial [Clostridiales bacterium]|nr:hypothetical protein [Clostridiales bacterium]